VEPPACGGCGGDLTGAEGRIASSVQVFDIPTFCLAVTEYLMLRRTCGCGYATTADLPAGVRGGPACYGPNVAAACTLLASQDVIGLERTADLMSALLGVEVSTGFISSCLARLDSALTTAEFEDALKAALREADVLGTDETPAPLTDAATAEKDCHNPHVYTVRTMCAYTGGGPDRTWSGTARPGTGPRLRSARSGSSTVTTGPWSGTTSVGMSLMTPTWPLSSNACRICSGTSTTRTPSTWSSRCGPVRSPTPYARRSTRSTPPAPPGRASLDADLLAKLRRLYDQGVAVGISTNTSRPWHEGNHPGLQLARRLKRKAHQVWIFAERFDIPATNNGSENTVRGFKLAEKVKGCWRTLATLQNHCRIRSYLVSARSHGRRPVDAITDALAGKPWMPPTTA